MYIAEKLLFVLVIDDLDGVALAHAHCNASDQVQEEKGQKYKEADFEPHWAEAQRGLAHDRIVGLVENVLH